MTNYFMEMGLIMFSMSIMTFISRKKHILAMLMSLEMVALSFMILITSSISMKSSSMFPLILFICMVVCEASLGLSILVFMSRTFGSALVSSSNLFSW